MHMQTAENTEVQGQIRKARLHYIHFFILSTAIAMSMQLGGYNIIQLLRVNYQKKCKQIITGQRHQWQGRQHQRFFCVRYTHSHNQP